MLVAPLPLPEPGHQKAPLPSGGAFAFLGAGFQQYVLDSKSTAQDQETLVGQKFEIIGRIDLTDVAFDVALTIGTTDGTGLILLCRKVLIQPLPIFLEDERHLGFVLRGNTVA